MSNDTLVLKSPRGWFAAGAEVQKAMDLLSDLIFTFSEINMLW